MGIRFEQKTGGFAKDELSDKLCVMKYWTGAHTKHRLMIHIVWIPKYRKRILKGALAKRIGRSAAPPSRGGTTAA